jgi:hypothetical protein
MPSINNSRRTTGRRVVRILGFLTAAVLVVWLYVFAYDHVSVVRLDNMYDPKYGDRVGRRDEYFAADFPSSADIEKYLLDSTLLFSQPPRGNRVYYFDGDHKFISWREDIIHSGKWWTSPRLQIIRLGERWRAAVVYTFCSLSFDMPADAQRDNCYGVETITSLLARGPGSTREYRKGNVFGLFDNKPAPFRLPNSAITIDSLLSSKNQ